MLTALKLKLGNNPTTHSVLADITTPSWAHSLSPSDLDEIAKLLQNKSPTYKMHPKVTLALYSIIIMKQYQPYNTKLAIDVLTKYYRSLLPTPEQHTQMHTQMQPQLPQVQVSKTRLVVANLLIRIPTFSNYKLIIRDIHPDLVGVQTILQHRDRMYKQCPNLYKDHLLKQHKHIWHELIQGDCQNYPLHLDFRALRAGVEAMGTQNYIVQLHALHQTQQKLVQLIRSRISGMTKQEINAELLVQQVQAILKHEIPKSNERKLILLQVAHRQEQYIRNIKSATLELLRLLVAKLKYSIYRKFAWVVQMLDQLLNRPYDAFSIEPVYLIGFATTLLTTFGIGFYNFDHLVHTEGTFCLFSLVSALAYNDYSKNNKSQATLINYQSSSTKNQQKKKNAVHINIYNTTVVDTVYEPYLKTTTPHHRQLLLTKILLFLKAYYSSKLSFGADFYYSTQLFGVLATSKNSISATNQATIDDIKANILFKGFEQIGDHFEEFCEATFHKFIKKKSQKKLQIHRMQQVVIQPTLKVNKKQADSYVSFASKQQPLNESGKQIKRTSSFDMQFEGWGNHKSDKKNQSKHEDSLEKSQLFYSIKECKVSEEKDGICEQKDKKNNQGEQQFILTPEF